MAAKRSRLLRKSSVDTFEKWRLSQTSSKRSSASFMRFVVSSSNLRDAARRALDGGGATDRRAAPDIFAS